MSVTETQTSTAKSPKPLDLSAEAQTLRAELKTWETAFAAAHHGRKAGRGDIKQHPDIAQKYKAYTKLRARLSTALPTHHSSSPRPPAQKRKRPSPDDGPSPPQPQTQEPSPKRRHPSALDPYDPPPLHLTPTPRRTVIGPTPQKNGLVLGLFDLLSPKRTPSKPHPISAAQRAEHHSLATPPTNRSPPSKNTLTPSSVRTRPPSLLTPTARHILQQTPTASRTSARPPHLDDTPAFLRRSAPLFPSRPAAGHADPLSTQPLDDTSASLAWSPPAVRRRRKPPGRSLSTLAQGLRAMEEEALDEELALLREMEGEPLGFASTSTDNNNDGGGKAAAKQPKVKVELLVQDSQAGEMPLGPDGEGEGSSAEEEEEEEEERRVVRTWKKKGQKRSTRRVVMRPVVGRWRPEREWVGGVDGEGEGGVRETQVGDGRVPRGEEVDAEEGEQEKEKSAGEGQENGKEKKTKAPRKVSATAHANFRALKIRNKQSKGKKGGRFGRR